MAGCTFILCDDGKVLCFGCGGTGIEPETGTVCSDCNGAKAVDCRQCTTCPRCSGSGRVDGITSSNCLYCEGSGQLDNNSKSFEQESAEQAISDIANAEFVRLLSQGIVQAFDQLGGDPATCAKEAQKYSLSKWKQLQRAKIMASGAASNLVPGAHFAAMVGDLLYTFRNLAYSAWGVGAILGKKPMGDSDLHQIMTLWAGEPISSLHLMAISAATYKAAESVYEANRMTANLTNQSKFSELSELEQHMVAIELYELLQSVELAKAVYRNNSSAQWNQLSMEEKAEQAVKNVALTKLISRRLARSVSSKMSKKVVSKLATKIAVKVAKKMAPKLAAKAAGGFIPLFGAAVGAAVNAYFFEGFIESAEEYYNFEGE